VVKNEEELRTLPEAFRPQMLMCSMIPPISERHAFESGNWWLYRNHVFGGKKTSQFEVSVFRGFSENTSFSSAQGIIPTNLEMR
jgi:hypothetical protein